MKPFHSILSTAYALLVLFASSNLMVGIHLCGGQIQNVALFGKANGCEKEKLPPCHRHESIPCCQDETIVHDAQDFNDHVTQINITATQVVDVVQPAVLLDKVISSESISRFHNYDPPLRSRDLTVSLHVFLI